MRHQRAANLFAAIILLTFGAVAIASAQPAPQASTSPPASSGKSKHVQSSKGGRLHGLDRADQAAGQHGQRGRETAREAQVNRSNHPERSGRSEHPVKPEVSDR